MGTDEDRNRPAPQVWRSVFRALATGIFGTVVVTLFLQNFVQDQLLAGLLPIIAAFNATVAGFTLVKGRSAGSKAGLANNEQDIPDRITAPVVGGFSALLSLGALSLLGCDALAGEFFDIVLLIAACLGGLVCGAIGAWIGAKHAELTDAKA